MTKAEAKYTFGEVTISLEDGLHDAAGGIQTYRLFSKEAIRYAEGCKRMATILSYSGPFSYVPTTFNGYKCQGEL